MIIDLELQAPLRWCANGRAMTRECLVGALNASLSPSTMSVPSVPPPTYTPENEPQAQDNAPPLQDIDAEQSTSEPSTFPSEAQLLICPPLTGVSQFQKGYLGAGGERAAIEGELQIKGVPLDEWERLYVLSLLSIS